MSGFFCLFVFYIYLRAISLWVSELLNEFENYTYKITATCPGEQWINPTSCSFPCIHDMELVIIVFADALAIDSAIYMILNMRVWYESNFLWVLTHWGLVMPFGHIDLGQHWLK